jgi:ApbE superfamily uncharacterized protein (UPF0280 family)
MRSPPQIGFLPDGRRLHLHDGPIDLIVEAFGAAPAVRQAYDAGIARFATVLDELCGELALLRSAVRPGVPRPRGRVALRMRRAVEPFAPACFITPMAAVAGAVAEEVLAAMTDAAGLTRAYVNNGGDIALHLGPGTAFTVGMADDPERPALFGELRVESDGDVRGIATSGWRGRSFSLGIADAVTVLAPTAAAADAAATVIANAVDLPGHPAVLRVPACSLQPDSDLADRAVTRAVGSLTPDEIETALDAGAACARRLMARSLISAAALNIRGETRIVGLPAQPRHALPFAAPISMKQPILEYADV